jgi:hypothetical protein
VRLERYLQKKENSEVYNTFKRCATQRIDHLFPRASETLRGRAADSIAKRRSRISYNKHHQQKLSTLNEPPHLQPLSMRRDETKPLPQPGPEASKIPASLSTKILEADTEPSVNFSTTEVTKLVPERGQAGRNGHPESVASAYISQSGFPTPPKVLPGKISFVCPYCCLEYPAKEASVSPWA